ncbi:MAG: MFS transporter [Candidatus Methanoplasma sp.]|jgi:EmrB/QacA subfamily drug resistance transporter|nr:MFS transporter [Candidatus Methanoplasma sp.]
MNIKRSAGAVMMLSVVMMSGAVDGIDGSIVNVALPTLADEFATDMGTVSWISAVYFLMLAGLLLTFGRIAMNGAVRKVLVGGLVLFTSSSLLCGLSDSFLVLMAFRALQGVGAAAIGAAAPMLCVRYVPREMMGTAMGVLIMGWSVGFGVGPVIGGYLLEAASWHWVFFINIPIGVAAVALAFFAVPSDGGYSGEPLDFRGAALLFAAVSAGALALERVQYPGEGAISGACAVLCALSLALFVAWEARCGHPLLNVRAFRHVPFDLVYVSYVVLNLVYIGIFYLLPFYASTVLKLDPSTTGLMLLAPSVVTVALCIPMSRWSDRTRRRPFCMAACASLFLACVALVASGMGGAWVWLAAALVFMGLTWALCGGPMAGRVVETVKGESQEMASSLMYEAVYIGCVLGVALFALTFSIGAGTGGMDFADIGERAFRDGFTVAMLAGAAMSAAIAAASLIVKEPKHG